MTDRIRLYAKILKKLAIITSFGCFYNYCNIPISIYKCYFYVA